MLRSTVSEVGDLAVVQRVGTKSKETEGKMMMTNRKLWPGQKK